MIVASALSHARGRDPDEDCPCRRSRLRPTALGRHPTKAPRFWHGAAGCPACAGHDEGDLWPHGPATIMPVKTYACSITRMPTRQASAIECQKTKRRIVPSWPNQLVAVEATTIDCASIILPITPPDELAAPIRIGERPSCSDVIFCRLPNRMFDAVSEPVSATPSHPSSVPKKG